MYRSEEYKTTKNAVYLIKKTDNKHLYSIVGAKSPRPAGLYTSKNTSLPQDHGEQPVTEWTPNVRLYNKHVLNELLDGQERAQKKTGLGKLPGPAGKWIHNRKQSQQIRSLNRGKSVYLSRLKTWIEENLSDETDTGMVSANDCERFANKLQALIAVKEGHEPDHTQIGEGYKHTFPSGNVTGCLYHATTVVAEDDQDVVTLEAHAGQYDLDEPRFHIYPGGTTGFKQQNLSHAMTLGAEHKEGMAAWHNTSVEKISRMDKDSASNSVNHMKMTWDQIEQGIHDTDKKSVYKGLALYALRSSQS